MNQQQKITLVAAMSSEQVIGCHNNLPWSLPDDLAHFKRLTLNKTVVMGRKTFESMGCKPLPQRHNIVLTRDQRWLNIQESCAQITYLSAFDEVLSQGEKAGEIMVIGGGAIFELVLPLATKMELTCIDDCGAIKGDVFFPRWDVDQWQCEREVYHSNDNRHIYGFNYRTYIRRQ